MRLILHGAFEGTNFGDTLLLRLFADHARALGVQQLFATNVSSHAAEFCHVAKIARLEAIATKSPIVFCGGGYFGEPPKDLGKWQLQLWRKHLSLAVPAAVFGLPTAILGVGVGPLSRWWVRRPVEFVFRRSRLRAVRDEESVDYVREYFSQTSHLVADSVLSCTRAELLSIARTPDNRLPKTDSRFVAVHLSGDSDDREERRGIAEALRHLVKDDPRLHLLLISDKEPGRNQDFFPWFDSVDQARVTALPFVDPSQLLSALSRAWAIVSTKLHVGICGAVFGARVLSIPRHPKTLRLYRQLHRSDACRPLGSSASASMDVLTRLLSGESPPLKVPDQIHHDAKLIWKLFGDYLRTL